MKILLLFVLTSVAGGLGRIAPLLAGDMLAPGLGLLLQLVLGAALLVVAVLAAVRMGLLRHHQRGWAIIGGTLGVLMATLVSLATLSSPFASFLVPMMVGMGATLGSLIGKSAHERLDLT